MRLYGMKSLVWMTAAVSAVIWTRGAHWMIALRAPSARKSPPRHSEAVISLRDKIERERSTARYVGGSCAERVAG